MEATRYSSREQAALNALISSIIVVESPEQRMPFWKIFWKYETENPDMASLYKSLTSNAAVNHYFSQFIRCLNDNSNLYTIEEFREYCCAPINMCLLNLISAQNYIRGIVNSTDTIGDAAILAMIPPKEFANDIDIMAKLTAPVSTQIAESSAKRVKIEEPDKYSNSAVSQFAVLVDNAFADDTRTHGAFVRVIECIDRIYKNIKGIDDIIRPKNDTKDEICSTIFRVISHVSKPEVWILDGTLEFYHYLDIFVQALNLRMHLSCPEWYHNVEIRITKRVDNIKLSPETQLTTDSLLALVPTDDAKFSSYDKAKDIAQRFLRTVGEIDELHDGDILYDIVQPGLTEIRIPIIVSYIRKSFLAERNVWVDLRTANKYFFKNTRMKALYNSGLLYRVESYFKKQ
jgi:hypothetical protein